MPETGGYFREDALCFSLSFPHLLCGVLTLCKRVLAGTSILVEAVAALVDSVRTQLCPLLFAILLHLVWDFSRGIRELVFCGFTRKQQRECLQNHSCCPAARSCTGLPKCGRRTGGAISERELHPQVLAARGRRSLSVCSLLVLVLRTQKQLARF